MIDEKPANYVKKSVSLADLKAITYVGNNDESEDNESWQRFSFDDSKVGNSESSSVLSNGDENMDETCENTKDDFRLIRIEKWVSEVQNFCGCFIEERNELLDNKSMLDSDSSQAVKKYLSSLSSSATFAQLVNRGLVFIPFLGAFTSLKSLDLRGNVIAMIAGGSLPRGLHTLNLSNNNISTIEGLRELTRLRVLDLSYNRLIRVGHGLGSCSSLKELYLGGNKIGEVEGLQRLLKLNVLDLRFNKISSTKCLRQLAANYNLQAINLEGNPAEKHVGDEHLKKYLQGLLPHLTFFNKQSIIVRALKNSSELRNGSEIRRKGGPGSRASLSSHRILSSSVPSHKSHLPKVCKSGRAWAPPKASKGSFNHHHYHGCGFSKVVSFRGDISMRRSRSEANIIGAF